LTICGGGNLAHASIATIGHNNPHAKINLLSRRPEVWGPQIKAITKGSQWEEKGDLIGKIQTCSDKAEDVIPNSDVIILCSPAHTKIEILTQIRPYIKQGAYIGTIFGQGGFDLQCKYSLEDDIAEKALTILSS
jgi:ornithine cyclodeaminase/alanine dehydrogenase-like protein (mu-crystallin family)